MTPVLGPDGRGVIVAGDRGSDAFRDRLEDAGIPVALPRERGLRAVLREDPAPADVAAFWSRGLRRPAAAPAGDAVAVATEGVEVLDVDPAVERLATSLDLPRAPRVAVFGGAWVHEDDPAYLEAVRFGERCAREGIEVVTGGYGGIMAAASRGAVHAGGLAIGVTIGSFSERVQVFEGLSMEVEADDLFARLPVICDADAWVAFPGGVGTLSELALCWSLVQTSSAAPRPLVILGEGWDRALAMFRELLLAESVHFELIRPVASADEAFSAIRPG